jgi:hypothetical protein
MNVVVQPDSLDRLRRLEQERVLLLPNHPTFHDWIAIFWLSAQVGQAYHYMAAYERFKTNAWFLQGLGAYSIRRGLGDRSSVTQTIELLQQPGAHLVIFPEGGCSFQNDTVMPFRGGAVQVALQAMSRIVKQGSPVPDLYAVPISLKYRYTGNMNEAIHTTLARLEQALRIDTPSSMNPDRFYTRLRRVAEWVLVSFEMAYGLHTSEMVAKTWNERIPIIKQHLLESCERELDITPPANQPLRERVYKIQYVLEARAESLLGGDRLWSYESMHKAAERLLNFDAIYDGYVAEVPTAERFLDTLVRLERAVFSIGQPVPKGHRQVLIHVGEPVNLRDYFDHYMGDRTTTVDRLITELRQQVQTNLDQLQKDKLTNQPVT